MNAEIMVWIDPRGHLKTRPRRQPLSPFMPLTIIKLEYSYTKDQVCVMIVQHKTVSAVLMEDSLRGGCISGRTETYSDQLLGY